MIVGNDVSEFQGTIDWNTYKNNSNFVIIRSTYGNGYMDKKFVEYRTAARNAGMLRGFYHYAYPQYNAPEDEATWAMLQLSDLQEGEIVALDFEENWSGDKVTWCKRWLDKVGQLRSGYKPLIYLNQSLISGNDWSPVVNAGYGLWVAAYTYDPNKNNFVTGAWKFAAMQQWTNQQKVPGTSGNVDGDVFFGDANAFKAYGYKAPAAPPPAGPTVAQLQAQLDAQKKAYTDLQTVTATQLANMKTECQADIQALKSKIKTFIDTA